MFNQFLKFNVKLSPVYLILAAVFIFGILLTGDEDTYVTDMIAVIAQITLILIIPNLIYMFKNRKQNGSFLGLISMLPLIPIPFIILAVIMRLIYV